MTTNVKMDVNLGDATVQKLNNTASEAQTLFQNLDSQVQSLFATWQGNSRQRFEGDYAGWKQDFNRCTELFRQMAQRVQKETNEIRQADQA